MKDWLAELFHPGQKPAVSAQFAPPSGDLLALQKEAQALRIELEAREQKINLLKQEIDRLRLRQDQLITETVDTHLTSLFNDLAGPASQILTQADLLERQDKPVQARDVLSVARRMVRALERYGVAFVGQVGEQINFDPNQHTPIHGAELPQAGHPVTIRFVGVTYQGKTIYKAIVE